MYKLRKVWLILLLFGLISLFSDVTYEGARGIVPSYLDLLGASAIVTGGILGIAEFFGYILRLPFGWLSDKTRRYWFLTSVGYFINLLAVPMLAFTNNYIFAFLLLVMERVGKALRTPSREVLLSGTVKHISTGKVFGIHEFLDQLGAMIGPLYTAFILLYYQNDYRLAFLTLFIPATIALIFLLITWWNYDPEFLISPVGKEYSLKGEKLTRRYWLYVLGIFLSISGLLHFGVYLYIAKDLTLFDEWFIPILYFIVMGVDGLVALLFGFLYDRFGTIVNITIPVASICIGLLLLNLSSFTFLVIAVFLGISLGVFESVSRGAITDITTVSKRGLGYGFFYAMIGIGLTISGLLFGFLFENGLLRFGLLLIIPIQFLAMMFIISSSRS